ncbi:MAG TPA: beta-ketoacyl-[acyl-carrier-protein] synthase family protein [Candidatus Binatia bacterium]
MSRVRVVVTGMGVVAPNAVGVGAFAEALREGRSGLRNDARLRDMGFACTVSGVPEGVDERARARFGEAELAAMNQNMVYAALAADEAWRDAGLPDPRDDEDAIDWDCGAVIGTGIGGIDTVAEFVVPMIQAGKVRRLGSTCVERVMTSNVSAKIAGMFGLGNQVTTNSSACSTGTESVLQGLDRIRSGRAKRMLVGGSEAASPHIWAGFDSMRVLARAWNDDPQAASRPMSAAAGGFVPAAGAGILVLESLDSALERGARIHAEVLGGAVNCGGQRAGGSMTAPNPRGVQRCIRAALADAGVDPDAIDAVSGHLTATMADPLEIANWAEALGRGRRLPMITSTKSLIGHTLGAAGGIETVAAVAMLEGGFVHGSRNCEDLHPDIEDYAGCVVHRTLAMPQLEIIAKASFGFGDVNACLLMGSGTSAHHSGAGARSMRAGA